MIIFKKFKIWETLDLSHGFSFECHKHQISKINQDICSREMVLENYKINQETGILVKEMIESQTSLPLANHFFALNEQQSWLWLRDFANLK